MPKTKSKTSSKEKTDKKNKPFITTYTTLEQTGHECTEHMSKNKADLIMNPINAQKLITKTLVNISEVDETYESDEEENDKSLDEEENQSENGEESVNPDEMMEESDNDSDDEESKDEEYDLNVITKDYAKTYLLPVSDKPPSMQELVKMVEGSSPSDMTTVGAQKINKERESVFEEYSKLLAPHHLPVTESDNYELKATKYVLPLTLKMKSPKYGNYKFNNARALVAVLKAMQIVSKEIYLAPVLETSDSKILVNPTQIPIEENALKQYMMTPTNTRTRVFITKIIKK
jgi:hypothetical protein